MTTPLAVFSSIAALTLIGTGCDGTQRPAAQPVDSSSAATTQRPAAQPVDSSSAASCVAAVEWHGKTYFGTVVQRELKLAQPLGEGTLPSCNDVSGSEPEPGRSVKLASIEGVSSDEAVAVAGDRSTVYVGPGYFPQLPHTPLHDLIFGPLDGTPYERLGCELGHTPTADVRAVVRGASFGTLRVTLLSPKGYETEIFSDAQTDITGGGSPPHVSAGDLVRASVLVCHGDENPHFLKLVATHLTLPSNGS